MTLDYNDPPWDNKALIVGEKFLPTDLGPP